MEALFGNFEGFYGEYGEKFLPAIVASLICAIFVFAWRSTEGMFKSPMTEFKSLIISYQNANQF